MSMFSAQWSGAHVLDCYAGSGAFGFEALSRGAERVTFIERHSRTAQMIKAAALDLEVTSQVDVIRDNAEAALRALTRQRQQYDVLFFDPPYAESHPIEVLSSAFVLAKAGAVLIWESGVELEVPQQLGQWQLDVNRRYGSTKISVYRITTRGT